ncbi:hypothetical protein LZD49_32210 [Dyadobacter sp. CY261]|uniref:hypothetical protein n=1 Tax=Dyadobacter sp. CY261 TaxID=2907203 RepID=UPI001F3D63B2|nr:hypothetical protein [Dyadobacter sp. CY261]
MLPIPEGADIICEYVEDWTNLKPGTLCVLILKAERDFVFKQVTINSATRAMHLESLNQAYKSYEVNISDVLEVWKFHSYVSVEVPERISDIQHISITMNTVLKRLKVIEDKMEE